MATYELAKTSIHYVVDHVECQDWDDTDLGKVLAGRTQVVWDGVKAERRSATRITYTWPAQAVNCSRMVIYLPFDSQSSPGRCAAYLSTVNLDARKVADSDWIGPSNELNAAYIAKCADPYWDAECTEEVNNGTWYGPGSTHPEREGIYFGFDLTAPMQPNGTYYVYIIQEEGNYSGTGSDCELYGTTSATATLTYEPIYSGIPLFINGAWKMHQAYKYNGTTWVPVQAYRYDGTSWKAIG